MGAGGWLPPSCWSGRFWWLHESRPCQRRPRAAAHVLLLQSLTCMSPPPHSSPSASSPCRCPKMPILTPCSAWGGEAGRTACAAARFSAVLGILLLGPAVAGRALGSSQALPSARGADACDRHGRAQTAPCTCDVTCAAVSRLLEGRLPAANGLFSWRLHCMCCCPARPRPHPCACSFAGPPAAGSVVLLLLFTISVAILLSRILCCSSTRTSYKIIEH